MKRLGCFIFGVLIVTGVFFVACSLVDGGTTNGNGNGETNEIIPPSLLGAGFFVSADGDDNNDGSAESPVRSLQKAVELAAGDLSKTNIFVASGVYAPGNGLNTESESYSNSGVFIDVGNLTILGGCNNEFTERNGITELDGLGEIKHVIWIDDFDNVTIDGFVIRGGNANDEVNFIDGIGGGIFIYEGKGNIIQNTVISNNTSGRHGGGVCIWLGENHILNAVISDNSTFEGGGGIIAFGGTNHTLSGIISGNTGRSGGGIHLSGCISYIVNATITGNAAVIDPVNGRGGGIFVGQGEGITISGIIFDNEAINGGGVYFLNNSGDELNTSHVFDSPTIEGNSEWGIDRANDRTEPQGLDTVNWGSGNTAGGVTPKNVSWLD
jgi:hypothetical protein